MKIFLAGGAGYIGSHTAVELLASGYEVVIGDNYVNSSPKVIERIEKIAGIRPTAYEVNIEDYEALKGIFLQERPDLVIHFAGLKAVGESVREPLRYYKNNINTTISILEAMEAAGVKKIIFSSSATVYGESNPVPYHEEMPKGECTNPYGWTKSMMEQILSDAVKSNPDLGVVILRYFNPIGAHESGLIGEDPKGIPNNIMPYISQVAIGVRDCLTVFGGDYDTPDGTCQRDYIHVVDLAQGHVKAIRYFNEKSGLEVFNLGTGRAFSVLELVNTFQKVNNIKLNYVIGERRPGDIPVCYADVSKAEDLLQWKTKRSLEDMCRDTWKWQSLNPSGYGS